MKIEWKSCFRVGFSVFLLYLCIHYWSMTTNLVLALIEAASPLVIGCVIAYLVNILMSFYEKHIFIKNKISKDAKRVICMLGAFLTLVTLGILIVILILPQIVECIQVFIKVIPDFILPLLEELQTAEWLPKDVTEALTVTNLESKISQIADVLLSGIGDVFGFVSATISSVFSWVVTVLLSFIFSIYLLIGKETLKGQCVRVMKNYLSDKWNKKIFYILSILDECFHKFIVGQCIEAVILGCLCTAGMVILRLPYATMIGSFIAFTALIPVAGAYIGAGVGVFMILTVSPVKALIFLIYILILQQVEGNIIYPKVVGSSIGLPGIWVLTAVTVGGSILGVGGMLLGVPIAATVFRILKKDIKRREDIQFKATVKYGMAMISNEAENEEITNKIADIKQEQMTICKEKNNMNNFNKKSKKRKKR